MLSSNSLLLSSTQQQQEYYPPSPPLSSLRSPLMSKTSVLSNPWCPPSNNNKSPSTEPSSFLNLEKVVQTYGSQPELLELILSSKVEEDRRRAEEAKLRRKEIDYMLQHKQESAKQEQHKQHKQQEKKYQYVDNTEKSYSNHALPPISPRNNNNKYQYSNDNRMNSFSSESSLPRLHQQPNTTTSSYHQYNHQQRRDSSPSPLLNTWRHSSSNTQHYLNKPSSPKRKNSSNIEMLLIPSPKSLELKLPELSSLPSSTSSTIKNINLLNYPTTTNDHNKRVRSSISLVNQEGESEEDEEEDTHAAAAAAAAAGSAPPSPPSSSKSSSVHKRRRREMQAITTIIETREFPYNDDYLWKNNGNTVHKKTGFKSIYYKCSNSSKGCPVNKTVTFKDNGEHLIKYRGQHLVECNRIKRITDL